MPCIHGLDEINCPTCRLMRFTLPKNAIKIDNLYNKSLKSGYPLFKAKSREYDTLINETTPTFPDLHKSSINIIPTPRLLNKLPSFENKALLDRLGEIEISKSDIFKISKRDSLASPEWKIEEKD